MKTILVINGPNLNLLGSRETEIYGSDTLEDIQRDISEAATERGVTVEFFQSNSEGKIIDHLQERAKKIGGLIINPGGLTHYSVALRDTLLAIKLPVIEVHLSNIYAREEFRAKSVISDIVIGQISGLGKQGYIYALDSLCKRLSA